MGVVTGIVQEFQFGMNWSDYARFVGDIFGAPLAMEGLLSFFLESTFIGLWIFGWVRLSPRLRLVSIWLAATGTFISACFILAANSFVQNPVGYRFNPDTNRVDLTDIWAVLTNKVTLVTFPHAIAATFLPGGGFVSVCRCGGWSATRTWTATRHARQQRLERPSCSSRRPRTPHTATHAYATCGTGYFALTLRAARTSS